MKKLLLAVLTGVLVEIATIAIELPSLPIGSTNALVEQSVRLVNEVWLGVRKFSSDGKVKGIFMAPATPYSKAEDGPLELFIENGLKAVLDYAIDPNDPSLQGVRLMTEYAGAIRNPITHDVVLLLATDNYFYLKEENGKFSIPEEAYKVDIDAAVMRSTVHAFLVSDVERATLVAKDGNGKVIKEFDSRKNPGPPYPRVVVQEGILFLPRDYIANATPGEVSIWYKDGTSQIFDLANGKLLSPVTTRLAIEQVGSSLKLTVIAPSGTAFVLEYSTDACFAKAEATGKLASEQTDANGSREYLITPTGEMKFFRARIVEPK